LSRRRRSRTEATTKSTHYPKETARARWREIAWSGLWGLCLSTCSTGDSVGILSRFSHLSWLPLRKSALLGRSSDRPADEGGLAVLAGWPTPFA
jgi:hypothetical protein